jgi:hypothetical protein
MITRAPTIRGRNSSSPAMSKDRVVTDTRMSWSVSPGLCRMEMRKFTTARWGICTPLGRPVDPEVYMT